MYPISEALLTEVLTRSGRLTAGEVVSIAQAPAPFQSIMSTILELEIQYSPDSLGEAPERCLMKIVEPSGFMIGKAEVAFYQFAASKPTDGLVTCFGTHIDEEEQSAFLLLEEHRGPFVQTEWPIPPDLATCARAVETVGRFHAGWWGTEQAARIGDQRPLPQADEERLVPRMAALFDKLGDALSPERRALIERLVSDYPGIHESRLTDSGRQTIVHGDAHVWNFLIPIDTARSPVLIDWQLWGVDFGAADLAYMIGLHWFPERRRRFEQGLIRGWAEALQQSGTDYEFEQAWNDYRFLVAGLLPRVVVYSAFIPANIWWPHLERAFLAFDDLGCAELFDS
jgi:aminoglycoside phosphotransferase (APT) family kinase protein